MARGRPGKNSHATNGEIVVPESQTTLERDLFLSADKLRKNLEPSDYKHVVLGLIFLRHISLAFEARHEALLKEDPLAAEDRDEYIGENIFWVPKEARWSHLQANAPQSTIGKLIDEAMVAIEAENPTLKGVLPKDYNRPALDKVMVGELVNLISGIALHSEGGQARDLLGRVYEYFLGGFAGSEGKRGGEFYTPRSVVRVLVEMLEPFPDPAKGVEGRVYDPCCGSGGMFVQTERFLGAHGGRIGQLAIYGQESNYTTWRLAKMNLAVRGIDASGIAWNNEGSFHKDEWRDKKFDFILANPPFNVSDWGGERLTDAKAEELRNATALTEDIVITHRGTLGQVGIIPKNARFPRYIISQSQMLLRADRDKISPRIIFEFLRSNIGMTQLLAFTSQTGVPAISKPTTSLKSLDIVVPSQSLVARFDEVLTPLVDKECANKSEMEVLAQTRDLLLPKLLSGAVRIRDVETNLGAVL